MPTLTPRIEGYDPNDPSTWYLTGPAPAPVALPAFGQEAVPLAAEAPEQPQGDPQAFLPGPGGMGGGEQAVLHRPDRLGRNPDDVQAMRMENARRQYEQRFGMSIMGPRGQRQRSMAASGQQEELDALIARLSQARMAHMADRRAKRRG
jgi:hypothetical protein